MYSRKYVQSAAVCDHDSVGAVVSDGVCESCTVPIDFKAVAVGAFCCPGLQEDKTDLRRRVHRISVALSACDNRGAGGRYEQISASSDHRVVEHILHKCIILLSSALDGIQRCHDV